MDSKLLTAPIEKKWYFFNIFFNISTFIKQQYIFSWTNFSYYAHVLYNPLNKTSHGQVFNELFSIIDLLKCMHYV